MAGIFDHMNHPGTGELQKTLNPNFMCGIVVRNILGLDNNAASLALINLELGSSGPIDAQAQQEVADLIAWVDGGTGVAGKAALLSLMCDIWGFYEQSKPDGQPWLDETEARSAFETAGVSWT